MSHYNVPPVFAFIVFFFNDTATTEIYTLSLHDALPICDGVQDWHLHRPERPRDHGHDGRPRAAGPRGGRLRGGRPGRSEDRKSTRLNSSHANISYAVFCLKKKKNNKNKLYSLRLRGHRH